MITAATGGEYQIACNLDHYGNDISFDQKDSITECIDECDAVDDCIDVTWNVENKNCYLKGSLSEGYTQEGVINALKV